MTEPAPFNRAAMEQRQQTRAKRPFGSVTFVHEWQQSEADLTAALAEVDRLVRLFGEHDEVLIRHAKRAEQAKAEVERLQQIIEQIAAIALPSREVALPTASLAGLSAGMAQRLDQIATLAHRSDQEGR